MAGCAWMQAEAARQAARCMWAIAINNVVKLAAEVRSWASMRGAAACRHTGRSRKRKLTRAPHFALQEDLAKLQQHKDAASTCSDAAMQGQVRSLRCTHARLVCAGCCDMQAC